jgi:hypothetical protein
VSDQDLTILDNKDGLSQTGDEILCFRKLDDSKYELSIRGYEFLGNIDEFCDDEGVESIPKFVDGKEVIEILPEFITGGNLVTYNEDEIIIFEDPNTLDVRDFLTNKFCFIEETLTKEEILKKVRELCSGSINSHF